MWVCKVEEGALCRCALALQVCSLSDKEVLFFFPWQLLWEILPNEASCGLRLRQEAHLPQRFLQRSQLAIASLVVCLFVFLNMTKNVEKKKKEKCFYKRLPGNAYHNLSSPFNYFNLLRNKSNKWCCVSTRRARSVTRLLRYWKYSRVWKLQLNLNLPVT